jgi:hypothetical protein
MMDVVFSADSHVIEPPEMWAERMDARYRDRAPRVVSGLNHAKGDHFVCDMLKPIPAAKFSATGQTTKLDVWDEYMERGMQMAPKGVWDPAERLKEQDRDGVHGELLYPKLLLALSGGMTEMFALRPHRSRLRRAR